MEYSENLKKLFLYEKEISGKEFLQTETYNKSERNIIQNLVEKNYLCQLKKGNKTLYSIGENGIEILRKDEDSWEDLTKEKKIYKTKMLKELLVTVKEGKKNVNKAFIEYFSPILQQAIEENLISVISSQKYELTHNGQNRLFALRPPEVIAKELQQIINDVSTKINTLSESVQNYFVDNQIQEHLQKFIETKRTTLEKNLEKAIGNAQDMEEEIKSSAIANKYKQEMISRIKQNNKNFTSETKNINQELTEELKKYKESIKQIKIGCSESKKNIREEQDEISMRLEKIFELHMVIKKNLGIRSTIHPSSPDKTQSEPTEEEIITGIELEYKQLMAKKSSTIISFSDLYNETVLRFPNLTTEKYLKILAQIHKWSLINLHPAKLDVEISKPELTIKDSLGNAYYLSWKH